MALGCFKIWPADKAGNLLGEADKLDAHPDPTNEKAQNIYFGVLETAQHPIPTAQLELQQEIDKLLRSVQQIYGGTEERQKQQFRSYYVRLFRLAQVGLEGTNVAPEISKSALAQVATDLIDDEAGRVKNGHLKHLGKTALWLILPFILLYLILRLTPSNSPLDNFLASIGIERLVLANFMMLWVGCFVGVWLSYGIRTTVFTLSDLTLIDSDRLQPIFRLLFAGTLTMLLGMLFMFGMVNVSLGDFSITDFSARPMLAFLVGAFSGVSELLLPSTVAKHASDLINKIK